MADKTGFEPAVEVIYTCFPSMHLKPLGHLSSYVNYITIFDNVLLVFLIF